MFTMYINLRTMPFFLKGAYFYYQLQLAVYSKYNAPTDYAFEIKQVSFNTPTDSFSVLKYLVFPRILLTNNMPRTL